MPWRFEGMPEELRLAVEQASGQDTEQAKLIYEAAVKDSVEIVNQTLKEVQSIIGPHGSITRLQSGGIRIANGEGIGVYLDGVLKTNIQPNGTLVVGSDVSTTATTTEIFFVEDTIYNSEQFEKGDFLIGDNTTAKSNLKFDASTGQLQFRYGTTLRAYVGTDGKVYAGNGDVWLDEYGINFANQEGSVNFVSSGGASEDVQIYIDGLDALVLSNKVGNKTIRMDIDDASNPHNVRQIEFDYNGIDLDTGQTYDIGGSPHAHNFFLPVGVYANLSPMSATAYPYAASANANAAITFVRWSQAWYVATTNDGSNYWTIALKDVSEATTYASFTTAAGSANTWTLANVTTFSPASFSSSDKGLKWVCTKTNAPGNLWLAGPTVEAA